MLEKFEQPEKEPIIEEITAILENIIEKHAEAKLTVLSLDGESENSNIITPEFIEDGLLWITTEDGWGISVQLDRIKKAEIVPKKE